MYSCLVFKNENCSLYLDNLNCIVLLNYLKIAFQIKMILTTFEMDVIELTNKLFLKSVIRFNFIAIFS